MNGPDSNAETRVLEYPDVRNFIAVITKAREARASSGRAVSDHFVDITEMVGIGSGAQRPTEDWAPHETERWRGENLLAESLLLKLQGLWTYTG